MLDFHVVLVEGFFHKEEPLSFAKGGERVLLEGVLAPLVGKRVQFAAHHLPSDPVDPTIWGGGSCSWMTSQWCPFAHHDHPFRLFNVALEGVLDRHDGDWVIETFDGQRRPLGLTQNLRGHLGRVAAAPVATVEEMRDALGGAADMVDALGGRTDDLRALMGRLKAIRGKA